jgi:murein DD-endopeptidase MepM/ murein hydrolase activator NlpD
MAEVTINNSPVHSDTILTGVYGQTGPSWTGCGFHTGTDFAPYGNTPSINAPLCSVCNGTVVQVRTESVLGNVIVIKEDNSNRYWRYCHLNSQSTLFVGATVTPNTIVGFMGQSGSGAHGVHLHLECSTTLAWQCATFLNCSNELNIPNVRGTIIHYDGTTPPTPPIPPTPTFSKSSSKWRLVFK